MRIRPDSLRVSPSSSLKVSHLFVPARPVAAGREPYHQVQGWRLVGDTYFGNYRVSGREYPGEIWYHFGKLCARISNLPRGVRWGRHSACFSSDHSRRGWWKVHFSTRPETVDAAILAIEQTIKEGL